MSYSEHIAIDIGSTYTKGALFLKNEGNKLELVNRLELPTDRLDVSDSCIRIHEKLLTSTCSENPGISFSSSAHGGLSMISIGLVPSFTEQAAKEAALSAGAKLVGSIAYRIGRIDLERIEAEDPDIILFTGGTDGGNRGYLLENAKMLAKLKISTVIIYAGNKDIRSEVKNILSGEDTKREVICCENILPTIDEPQLTEVREVIKDVFMQRITRGKGLQRACGILQTIPIPTPGSIFDFIERISQRISSKDEWCLIDIGGATTDCYSIVAEPDLDHYHTIPVFHHGLQNQHISRSVEGDLGMRLNAINAAEHAEDFPSLDTNVIQQYRTYAEEVSSDIAKIPKTDQESACERGLASICCSLALDRHAGRLRSVYTPEGLQYTQYGKDLSTIKKLVLCGGVTRAFPGRISGFVNRLPYERSMIPLTPQAPSLWLDADYIIPLLAQVKDVEPQQIQRFLWDSGLREIETNGEIHNE